MKTVNSNNFTFDDDSALLMCNELSDSWKKGKGAFEDYRDKQLPEAKLPENIVKGTADHANYYFWLSVINYQVVADDIFPRMRELHEKEPDMFDPAYVRKIDDSELKEFVKKIKHFPAEVTKRWRYNADQFEEFDDDIRNTNKTSDIRNTQQEIIKFSGFQYKQSALLLYWLKKYGLIEPFDETDLNIPVDVHVQRLSVRRNVCDFEGKTRQEVLERYLRNEYQRFFKENKQFDPFKIQEQMWILGSQSCVKNTSCRKNCVFEEPCERDLYVERENRRLQSTGKEYHGASGKCWIAEYRPFRPRKNKYGLSDSQSKLSCDC